jgi:sterol desaturase/sphingolipid hydroxylase (fatty acid hydroxylase superfamily)
MKCVSIVLLGASPLTVLSFEVMLNATAMFNHSNIRLPLALDRLLRTILVTPDMHRVHHSAIKQEANSNFGFNLPWWDFLFGTYRGQPDGGHEQMMIGLSEFRDDRVERLPQMLALPFIGKIESNPIKQDNGEPES